MLDFGRRGRVLLPDLARQMMRRLVEPTRTRARLFDIKGDMIADSRVLRGPGDAVQVLELPPPDSEGPSSRYADRSTTGSSTCCRSGKPLSALSRER